ncbi:MAG: DNA polymerase III subunit alpha [Pseudomonadota bacterium]|nr:DNA polymerase III subunit alpha [Pseudomonadota bacterium]
MLIPEFIHLRVHTAYSLSEGAIKIPELIGLCREHDMPAVGVTDTNNLFGALEFSMAAAEAGVQPIIGCQIDVRSCQSIDWELENDKGRSAHEKLVLLVQNETGYQNLMELVSDAFLTTQHGNTHTTLDKIFSYSEGLICLSGGAEGPLGRMITLGQMSQAENICEQFQKTFGDRFYIEIQRHGTLEENEAEPGLLELAYSKNIPLVATNDCYFVSADMYEAHDALLCIAGGTYVSESERRRLTADYHFRSINTMKKLFLDLPEALENTVVIAQRCAFMPVEREPILPAYVSEGGESEEDVLCQMAHRGLQQRLSVIDDLELGKRNLAKKPYLERLEYELEVILKMGYSGYFLIVADFIQWAKNQGIPVGPGRGSGAGSVVAWALTITDLDPLRFGLLFERFLNPDRVSMPDFDIDFCQDRRDEVIRYVQDKYGNDKVAQIITFGKLQARAVLRDVGRVLGMPYGQVDRITKLVPFNPAKPPTLEQAIESEPELKKLQKEDDSVAQLIDKSLKLEGLYRHASTHAAGVIIADRPLSKLVPLYKDPRSEMLATQFSMKYAELAGLVKFDFLGLKTLTVLQRAVDLISRRGKVLDLLKIPLLDEKTFEMLANGDTVGVFQLESSGMRDVLRNMRPDRFEDIIALVALYRPGPMDNIPRYIACKHGIEEPDYLHPELEEILKETFGVMIYQEQVMQIAQVLSGFSLGKADLLRRAMGKKIKSEMAAQREAFVNGAVDRDVERATAVRIFEQVDKFAGYGFNKSHAAAYALVAYQTAWLKANYPVEFLAASMTLDIGNTDKLNVFRQELERLGIPLLPPDINKSGVTFTVEETPNSGASIGVRYALAAIKNVGSQAMEDVVLERETNGDYCDVTDFVNRLEGSGANKRQFENLVRAGAFDCLDKNRKRLFEGAEGLIRLANQSALERSSGQENLFNADNFREEESKIRLPDTLDWTLMERLTHEFDAVGSFLSAHPLDAYASQLRRHRVRSASEVTANMAGTSPSVAGVVISRQERTSAKGNRFAFVQLSDASGVYEVVIFSELLSRSRDILENGQRVLITLEVRSGGDGSRLSAIDIKPLDAALAQHSNGVKIVVNEEKGIKGVERLLNSTEKGNYNLLLVLEIGKSRCVEVQLPKKVLITGDFRAEALNMPGIAGLVDV